MIFDKIQPLYFLIAFALGLLYCYISKPKPNVVIKFPSPSNVGKITYKNECILYNIFQTMESPSSGLNCEFKILVWGSITRFKSNL